MVKAKVRPARCVTLVTLTGAGGMGQEGVGDLIRRLRQAAGLTQVALAEAAGVTRSWLAQVERGAWQRPEVDRLKRLAPHLHVRSDLLLGAAGYDVSPEPDQGDSAHDPELDALLGQAELELTPEELQSHKSYLRWLLAEHRRRQKGE